jgi:hypothetical protein
MLVKFLFDGIQEIKQKFWNYNNVKKSLINECIDILIIKLCQIIKEKHRYKRKINEIKFCIPYNVKTKNFIHIVFSY